MDDEQGRTSEVQEAAAEIAAAIRALITRLEPGEVLSYDTLSCAHYKRISANDRYIEVVWIESDPIETAVFDILHPELESMVERGELIYGPCCSQWHRP